MADECEKKRDRITQSDMQHREKQQRMMETIRAEMYAGEQEATASNTTTPTSSHTTSPSRQEKRHHHQLEKSADVKEWTKTYKTSACNKQDKSCKQRDRIYSKI
jgi:hypothetical protein